MHSLAKEYVKSLVNSRVRVADSTRSHNGVEELLIPPAVTAEHDYRRACVIARPHSQNDSALLIEGGRPYRGPKSQ